MARKSIGDFHSRITADGSQFISEFARADRAVRAQARSIDAEVEKLARSVRKKFTLSEFGKDMLKGFGIGSAFGLVNTGVSEVQDFFARRAAAEKEHEASLARQAELGKEISRVGMNDRERLDALREERNEAFALLRAHEAAPGGDARRAEIDKLTEAYQKLNLEVAKGEAELGERNVAEHIANMDRAKAIDEELRRLGFQGTMDAFKVGGTQRSLAELKQARDLMAIERETIRGDLFADPEQAAARQLDLGQKLILTQTRINELTAEHDRLAAEVGATVAGAFEEAVLSGGRLSDVLRGLADDLLRLAFRQSITGPLSGFIGGAFTNFFGPAGISSAGSAIPLAEGGTAYGGQVHLVGERGPELFVPRGTGTVVPNHALGGGDSYVFNYSFASGVSRSELMPLLAFHQRDTIAKIVDAKRRGGGAARALA